MKPEFILGNQLRQYSETTKASKWGNNTGSH
nr:MAG TPA: glycosyltransferase [Caudoviricetes sp.]